MQTGTISGHHDIAVTRSAVFLTKIPQDTHFATSFDIAGFGVAERRSAHGPGDLIKPGANIVQLKERDRALFRFLITSAMDKSGLPLLALRKCSS